MGKVIVLTERPADGIPPLLIMGVTEESEMPEVQKWVNQCPERRGYVFTERLESNT